MARDFLGYGGKYPGVRWPNGARLAVCLSLVLEEGAELLYLHSAPYTPACEGALNVRDPRLAIAWPLPVQGLSARDAAHPLIGADFEGIVL